MNATLPLITLVLATTLAPRLSAADDAYEQNDTPATAYDLSANARTWLSSLSGLGVQADADWYRIYVPSGYERVVIDCRFLHADGNITLSLYSTTYGSLRTSSSTSDNEFIDFVVPTAGTYYIGAYLGPGGNAGNAYDLWYDCMPEADDVYEQNDTRETAYTFYEGRWLRSVSGLGVQADADWYRISVTTGFERLLIDCRFAHADGDIDVALYDYWGNRVARSTSITDNEYIDTVVSTIGGNTFYVCVYYGNAGNTYDLWWDDVSTNYYEDDYEQNDTILTAFDMTNVTVRQLSRLLGVGVSRDDDWYRISVPSGSERVVINSSFVHAQGNIDLALYDPSGIRLATAASQTDNEVLDYTVPFAGIYYMKVSSDNRANTYDLWWDYYVPQVLSVSIDTKEPAGPALSTWPAGSLFRVEWTVQNNPTGEDFYLYIRRDFDGSVWNIGTVPGGNGFHSRFARVPDFAPPGNDYRVWLLWKGDRRRIPDNNNFSIAPPLNTVFQKPVTGEVWPGNCLRMACQWTVQDNCTAYGHYMYLRRESDGRVWNIGSVSGVNTTSPHMKIAALPTGLQSFEDCRVWVVWKGDSWTRFSSPYFKKGIRSLSCSITEPRSGMIIRAGATVPVEYTITDNYTTRDFYMYLKQDSSSQIYNIGTVSGVNGLHRISARINPSAPDGTGYRIWTVWLGDRQMRDSSAPFTVVRRFPIEAEPSAAGNWSLYR